MDEVVPILEDAEHSLSKIKNSDVDFIKNLKVVGASIEGVMEGIIYAFDEIEIFRSKTLCSNKDIEKNITRLLINKY